MADALGGGTEDPQPPRTRLLQEVAEQMDAIEADFGDDFEIGRVVTVVEVTGPDGNVGVRVRSAAYPWVTSGLLRYAAKMIESS